MTKHIEKNRVSNIEKLFLNYTDKYEKINLNWDNEVGKEIWYNDEEKKSKKDKKKEYWKWFSFDEEINK